MPIGEHDKRLTLLTKEFGKITAFAKGARRAKSKLLAGTSIFIYGDFLLYKKKNYTVTQVECIDSFHAIREDIETLSYGLYLLEFAEFVSDENNPNLPLMKLILKTLQVLTKGTLQQELIICVFELKALSYIGLTPEVSHCVLSEDENALIYFSAVQGGVVCERCYNQASQPVQNISQGTLYTMRFILSASLSDLYTFKVDEAILKQLKTIMRTFIGYHINKTFKALEFLEATK